MSPGGSFGKYEREGAYHWRWADPDSPDYAPAAEARYGLLAERIGAGGRVLDVGCGDGYLLGRVAGAHDLAVGVDAEPGAVRIARDRLGPGAPRLAVAGAGSLPFPGGSFDTVVLAEVVEHLRRPGTAVAEAARVLREHGRLVVSTPQWRPDGMWDEAHHHREYRPDELRALLARSFREVALTHFLPRSWWTIRKLLGKGFVRAFARLFYNPFARQGDDPGRFWHLLAVCRGPRPRRG